VHVQAPGHLECEYWITEPFEAVVAYATIACRVLGKPEETEATIAAADVRASLSNLDDASAAEVLQELDGFGLRRSGSGLPQKRAAVKGILADPGLEELAMAAAQACKEASALTVRRAASSSACFERTAGEGDAYVRDR
jgi:hypothetical protein